MAVHANRQHSNSVLGNQEHAVIGLAMFDVSIKNITGTSKNLNFNYAIKSHLYL